MNPYEKITEKIIEQLHQGIIPWKKPWVGPEASFNRVTKRQYSILNQLLLEEPGEYASLKQWNALGGKIRSGEHGHMITFWKILEKKENTEGRENKECLKKVPVIRYYYVFHVSQVDGIEPLDHKYYPDVFCPDESADEIINGYLSREGIDIEKKKNGNQACYSPLMDRITIPAEMQFKTSNGYYDTLLHEMIHSTGHPKRLNRISISSAGTAFGSKSYAKEELTAEIGASMLMNCLNLETDKTLRNNAAYVQNWAQILENDSYCIVSAAGHAEKAVKMILNLEKTNSKEETL